MEVETMKKDVGISWKMVNLGVVAKISAGQSAPIDSDFSINEGLPFIRAGHLEKLISGYNIEDLPTINKSNSSKNRLKVLNKGSILFAKSGMSAMMNRVYLVEQETYYVSHLASVTPDNSVLDSKFCFYFLKYFKTSKLIKDSAYPSIGLPDIEKVEIPLPPLATQKRIAEILDAADALRRKDQALLQKYDQLAQAIFIDMFGDPVKNEKGWEVKKLKEICIKITDGTHFSPPNQPSGIPYITAKHLKQDVVDFYCNPTYISQKDHEDIFSRCTPIKGDVLYIKDGATTGIAAVNEYEFEFSMLSSLALIKPNKTLLNSYYLSSFLNNHIVKQELIRSYMAGAAIKRFTLDKINKFDIMLPPIELQNSFETKWKKLRQSITHTKDSKSNDLFQTILQKAFKGELIA